MPSTVLSSGDVLVNKKNQSLIPWGLQSNLGREKKTT